MSDEEIKETIDNCLKLKERQNTPDSAEALKSIPALSLDDISKDIEKLPLEERKIENVKVLHHEFDTNKICYVNLFFKTLSVEQNLIPYIALLSDMLGKCGTDSEDYSRLSNRININTGGISYSPITFSNLDKVGEYTPYLEVSFKCLDRKLDKTLEILSDILLKSNFDDEDRMKQIIGEKRARLEGAIFDNGHRIASKKVLSYCYAKGAYDEIISGLKYYEFLADLDDNFDGKKISENLKKVREAIFNKNNLLVSFSALENEYKHFEKSFVIFIPKLYSHDLEEFNYEFELCHKNEGMLTQGNVQYVAKGGNFKLCGYEYNGALSLLETILGFDYLWNNIRVKGGAYGVFSNFRRDGGAYIVSYRDPNIKETINVYDDTPIYIANFEADEREMTKYIIGTIRKHDQPISNSIKGDIATAHYLTNLTDEKLQKEREEIINADTVGIRSFAPLVNDLMKENYLAVIGNEKKIKEN
ncbi:MAG: insulinase family protein, partial [Sarcina sp.]